MNSHRSRRPLRFLAAMLAFITVSTLVAVTGPATPAGAIEVIPSPPGWSVSRGSSGRSSGGSQITFDCSKSAAAYYRGKLMFQNWPGCFKVPVGNTTGNYQIKEYLHFCDFTFEVWRFYGTRDNPVQARTVSRTNIDPCQTYANALVLENHPEDSVRSPALGLVAPYRIGVAFPARTGESASISYVGSYDTPTTYVFTSGWPFRRNGSCHALMGRDPNQSRYFWGGDLYNTPNNTLRSGQLSIWNRAASRWGTMWADAVLDRVGSAPNGEPILGDNGLDCSGMADFAVPAQAGVAHSQQSDVRLSGYCAIPVWREHARNVHPGTGSEWYEAIAPNVLGGHGTPEIYDTAWFGAYSQSIGDPTPANQAVISRYRESVMDEVATRPWAAATPGLFDQSRPPWASRDNSNLTWAAIAAGVYSHCALAQGNTYAADGPNNGGTASDTPLPGDAVQLTVNVPEAGQVGGANRAATTVTTNLTRGPAGQEVRCGASWCPVSGTDGPWLSSVAVTFKLIAPDGAEYKVRRQLSPDGRTGTDMTGLQLEFYKATGSTNYRVEATGTAVIHGYEGRDVSSTVCDPSMIGGACRTVTSSQRRAVSRTVPVQVSYNRGGLAPADQFPVVSATATPTEGRNS